MTSVPPAIAAPVEAAAPPATGGGRAAIARATATAGTADPFAALVAAFTDATAEAAPVAGDVASAGAEEAAPAEPPAVAAALAALVALTSTTTSTTAAPAPEAEGAAPAEAEAVAVPELATAPLGADGGAVVLADTPLVEGLPAEPAQAVEATRPEPTQPVEAAPLAEDGLDVATPAEPTAAAADTAAPVDAPIGPDPAGSLPLPAPARLDAAPAPVEVRPADAPATSPAAPPPVHEQVVEVVRPLHQLADGTHRLSLRLRPDELGAVTIEVALHHGTMSVHLVGETAAARDALAAGLADLRAELERAGVRTGWLDVGAQTREDASPGRWGESPAGRPGTSGSLAGDAVASSASLAAPPPAPRTSDGRVDVRM